MDESKRDMNGLSNAAEANRRKMRNWGLAITGAAVAVIGATTKVAGDFEEKMAEVHTLLGPESEGRIKELEENVKDMSIATGKSLDDLSGGLYQVISAFGESADSAAILETNAKAAAAGMATTTDSINLTSAITKAYGDTSAEAVEDVADLAFQTVRLGYENGPVAEQSAA
ncbi:phage tail tape measure protein [Halarsenatibacter silvermanii]|nr:phage tail tape measure protein [Halarsenatibacter silvermanii]